MSDEISRIWKQILVSIIPLTLLCFSSSVFAKDGKNPQNRLGKTSSPYLLHHADNPVDWYPWGPEAFEKAKKENKPIFLSIGYSSCYWCHVMERLVFSDEKIAGYMNEHFVNVKVDREERPDLDEIYMTALVLYFQATGSPQGGGWPLSMFLTPEAKPFAGGTYFPPDERGGRTSFPKILARVDQLWKENEKGIRQNADVLTEYVRKSSDQSGRVGLVPLDMKLTLGSIDAIKESFDEVYGGVDFSLSQPDAPKFPVPLKLALLQKAAGDYADQDAEGIVKKTLDHMANGGIYDHLGGGFHRYSTDRKWHVPHFEKMLYDQSQLISVYTEALRRTNDPLYKEVVEGTCDFVLRELTDSNGGFYSALDAETDGVEGKYYVWNKSEVQKLLGEEAAAGFLEAFGFNENEKFEHGIVLHRNKSVKAIAEELDRAESKLAAQLNEQKKILFNARQRRKALNKDDKILTSWNGLMISALADAGSLLGRQDYLDASEKAARFLLAEMIDSEKNLLHSWYHGQADIKAYLDDYAFLVDGMLKLYEVTGKEEWLTASRELTEKQIKLFWDETGDGFYFTAENQENLITRPKTSFDSVIPSGNSIAVKNLVALWKITGDDRYGELAEKSLSVHTGGLKNSPAGMAAMALALSEYLAISQIQKTENSTVSEKVAKGELILVSGKEEDDSEKKDELVEANIYLSRKKLEPGQKCEALLVANIKKGWHINANPAKPEGFIATVFSVESKEGVKLEKIYYPEGKPFTMAGIEDELSVYEKRVIFYGVLTVPDKLKDDKTELSFNVKYQACNDNICKKPVTVKLPASVPVAKTGEKVAPNNEKLFELYKKAMEEKKKKKE